MAVTKHDIEWLIHILELHENKLAEDLVNQARLLIDQSNYRKSVCVIHPVDESEYRRVRSAVRRDLGTG